MHTTTWTHPLYEHLGGDPGLLAQVAIEEIKRVPRNGMHIRDMVAIIRMSSVLGQLAADLHEAWQSTTDHLELSWWRIDTVQTLLGIEISLSDPAIGDTIAKLEGLAGSLTAVTHAGASQTALFSQCIEELTPWVNVYLTLSPKT